MLVSVSTVTKRKGDLEAALLRIKNALRGPMRVKVGYPSGAVGGDIVMRAVWNEFGTRGGASGGGWGGPVPERPCMRLAFSQNRGDYRKMMVASVRGIVTGRLGMSDALNALGERGSSDIKKMIDAGVGPVNAWTTVALKGHGFTLYQTGQMQAAATFEVD